MDLTNSSVAYALVLPNRLFKSTLSSNKYMAAMLSNESNIENVSYYLSEVKEWD